MLDKKPKDGDLRVAREGHKYTVEIYSGEAWKPHVSGSRQEISDAIRKEAAEFSRIGAENYRKAALYNSLAKCYE